MKCEISFSLSGVELRKSHSAHHTCLPSIPLSIYPPTSAIRPPLKLAFDSNQERILIKIQLIIRAQENKAALSVALNPFVCNVNLLKLEILRTKGTNDKILGVPALTQSLSIVCGIHNWSLSRKTLGLSEFRAWDDVRFEMKMFLQ